IRLLIAAKLRVSARDLGVVEANAIGGVPPHAENGVGHLELSTFVDAFENDQSCQRETPARAPRELYFDDRRMNSDGSGIHLAPGLPGSAADGRGSSRTSHSARYSDTERCRSCVPTLFRSRSTRVNPGLYEELPMPPKKHDPAVDKFLAAIANDERRADCE